MICYICDCETSKLFPIAHSVGKIQTTIYVCKDCFKKAVE